MTGYFILSFATTVTIFYKSLPSKEGKHWNNSTTSEYGTWVNSAKIQDVQWSREVIKIAARVNPATA